MVALCALLLLALLAVAAANTEFFDRYYSWLYAANAAVALILTLIVGGLAAALIARLRQGRFGTRLLAKLAVFFTLVGVLPGSLIYLISLQFVARSIESWFDVNIEAALESGLELGRAALDAELAELRREGVRIAARLSALGRIHSAALERLRARSGAQQAMVVSQTGRVLARAPALDADHLGQEIPTRAMLQISARADSVSGAWREISAAHAHRTGSARTQHARGATRLARLSNQEAGTDRPAQNVYRHFDARALLRKFSGDDIGACVGESAHAPPFPAGAGHAGSGARRLHAEARNQKQG